VPAVANRNPQLPPGFRGGDDDRAPIDIGIQSVGDQRFAFFI